MRDSATSATTITTLTRHESRLNAARGVSPSDFIAGKRSARTAPRERDVLARVAAAAPLEAEGIGAIGFGLAPRRDNVRAGSHLRARRIGRLHALTGQRRRTGQRLGCSFRLTRHRDVPRREIARHFEFDLRELHAANFGDVLRELGWPAATLTAEDRLQRFALLRVS